MQNNLYRYTTAIVRYVYPSAPQGQATRKNYIPFLLLLALLQLALPAVAQQKHTVTGTVKEASGAPIPGVTVLLKGTSIAAPTDIDGNYSITAPDGTGTLVFSYIGFQTQEVPINNRTTIPVTMGSDAKALDEVVVVGYGTQKKSDVTGSVASVSEEDFVKGQVTTPEQLITGKVAGVQITSNGGAPGSGSRIRIRGGSSLNASNDPLIVIDGVPVDNNNVAGAGNPLNFINPDDIASFNILKDASATAIYGSRASNGVIIITTKKGKAGDALKVNFSTQHSLATVTKTADVLSADEYRELLRREGTEAQIAMLGNASTDWQDLIFKEAYTTDNNLSLTGSIKKLPYRVSIGYLNQDGVLKTSAFERTSGAISLNPTFLDEHLKVYLNLKGALTNSRFADPGAIGSAVAFDPTQPVYANNKFGGYFQWTDVNGNFNTLATRNPLSQLEQRDDRGEVKRSIGNLQLDYKFHFLPELHANLNLGYDVTDSEGATKFPATFAPNAAEGGRISRYEQSKTNTLADFYLNYVKELNSLKSRVDVMAGYSFQEFVTKDPKFPIVNVAGDTIEAAANPAQPYYRLKSYFGRVNYAFKDKYLLTATIRRDGSSRFSEKNRWGTFPALAFAWRIIDESFLKDSRIFSDLKLRVGYGLTGQQDIGAGSRDVFPYLPRYTLGDNTAQYQFGFDAQGNPIYVNTLRPEGYDKDIKWEETKTYNAGLDFGFLNNRISGSLDYYFKDTKDLLATIALPAGTNLTNELTTNVGSLETRGVEAALNFNAINNDKLTWDIGINSTFTTRKITNLSRVNDETFLGYQVGSIAGGTGNNVQINTVGYAPYSFYVYKQVYDENGKPIEGEYEDLNGDGEFNEADKYRYKSPDPKVQLGFNSQLNYGNWNFSFVMRGSFGNYLYNNMFSNNGAYRAFSFSNYLTNVSSNVLETNFEDYQLFSDYYVENASFVRMDNINLGYNFGKILNKKVGLRLSASVQNAFVITGYRGTDPETQFTHGSLPGDVNPGGGIDRNFYPRPRIYTLGLNFEL